MRNYLKTIWAIFSRDIKRLVRNPIALLVTIGVCFLPSLYAWYCIAANWDPYGNTDALKVAVANNDEGATSQQTGHIDVGKELVDKLHENHSLGWQFVDETEAIEGVKSGQYYAAIVIPKNFSSDFTSVFTGDFKNPEIDYYVNEKVSSVTPKITSQGASTIEKTIDEQFISSVSKTVVEITQKLGDEVVADQTEAENALVADVEKASAAIAKTRASISGAIPQVDAAKKAASTTQSGIGEARSKADKLASELSDAQASLKDVREKLTEFSANATGALNAAASAIGSLDGPLAKQAHDAIVRTTYAISDAAQKTQQSLDEISTAAASLEGTAQAAGPLLQQAEGLTQQLRDVLDATATALEGTDSSLERIQQNVDNALTDLKALQNAQAASSIANYLKVDPSDVGNFMASPVQLQTHIVYPVANYGSGVAPFYTNLALWVSGFVLLAIVRMRVDPEGLPNFTARQAYFARWLFFILIGLIQAAIVCVGDLLIGIQCESPAAFIGAGLLAEFVYVNLLYALARAFRHIGKAIGVLLLIMQIPGSSGMYPVEMMPAFYQAIHPLLPFTYSIQAMREAIGGFYGLHYLWAMLALAAVFIPIGLFIGLFIGKRAYNLNLLFDDKLGETDLFVAEDGPIASQDGEHGRFKLRPVLTALLSTKEYRERLITRAERFRRNYSRLTLAGWIAIVVQPIATLAVMFIIQAGITMKLVLLCAMVLGIIIVDGYLIVIAYMNANIKYQLSAVDEDAEGKQ